jgi:hypothetical protein
MFLSKEGVPITVDDVNIVYIWEELPHGPASKALAAIASVNVLTGEVKVDVGEYANALLVHSILRWEGPKFKENGKQLACTPENIARFDRSDPLYKKLAQEVTERNPLDVLVGMIGGSVGLPSSVTPTDDTSPDDGTSISPAPNVTSGRRRK